MENFADPVARIQTQIYANMTYARKWQEFCRLRETAWRLKFAGVKFKNPTWTDKQIEDEVKKIFLYATT